MDKMKVWIVVATIWVAWTAMVGPPAWMRRQLMDVEEQEDTLKIRSYQSGTTTTTLFSYAKVKFTTKSATRDSYTQFIALVLDQLRSESFSHDIPKLRDPSTVPDSQRFFLVELSNLDGESVTLAIDVTDAYVVAYQAGDQSYFFRNAPGPAFSNLFQGTVQHTLTYSGDYTELKRIAKASREDISLGIQALDDEISTLCKPGDIKEELRARALTVIIQMVSEAARFRDIFQEVLKSITSHQNFRPNAAIINLENNWGSLSNAIQQSNEGGVFSDPVKLQTAKYVLYEVASVSSIIAHIAIMKFVCKDRRASQFSQLIRSAVADGDHSTCVDPEPTVRISGRNGLCVDVSGGKYNDGNPIILWMCKDQLDVNQLWTLKTDGTIRSNGKCLTTYGYSPGSYVMIYDCAAAVRAATRWQVWDNGTILNPESALVLSAKSEDSGTTLTVETNIYASRQGWLAGNNTEPFVAVIVGFMDLCMQAINEDAMWLVECESSKAEQNWAIYADASIRPQQNRDRCLTCKDPNCQGTIFISSCNPGSEGQRWVFKNDGTILNLNSGMVMDVKGSDPSLHQIIAFPFTGNPNQKWLPLL